MSSKYIIDELEKVNLDFPESYLHFAEVIRQQFNGFKKKQESEKSFVNRLQEVFKREVNDKYYIIRLQGILNKLRSRLQYYRRSKINDRRLKINDEDIANISALLKAFIDIICGKAIDKQLVDEKIKLIVDDGNEEGLRAAIQKGGDFDLLGDTGKTALLYYAIEQGKFKLATLMITEGKADPILNDSNYKTAVEYVEEIKIPTLDQINVAAYTELKQEIEKSRAHKQQEVALERARRLMGIPETERALQQFDHLLETEFDVNFQEEKTGKTILHYAVEKKKINFIEKIVAKSDVAWTIPDRSGVTAVDWAFKSNDIMNLFLGRKREDARLLSSESSAPVQPPASGGFFHWIKRNPWTTACLAIVAVAACLAAPAVAVAIVGAAAVGAVTGGSVFLALASLSAWATATAVGGAAIVAATAIQIRSAQRRKPVLEINPNFSPTVSTQVSPASDDSAASSPSSSVYSSPVLSASDYMRGVAENYPESKQRDLPSSAISASATSVRQSP